MHWNEVKLDKSCPGNNNMKLWISANGEYAKKGCMIYDKWNEVIYRLNKCTNKERIPLWNEVLI